MSWKKGLLSVLSILTLLSIIPAFGLPPGNDLFIEMIAPSSISANQPMQIEGKLQNLTSAETVPNYPVIIEILERNTTLVRTIEVTDENGLFKYQSPLIRSSAEFVTIRASISGSVYGSTMTVLLQKTSQPDYFALGVLIGLIFGAFLCFYISTYHSKELIFVGFGLVTAGYAVLAISPPTNDLATKAGFAVALLAPIATSAFNQLKSKQDADIKKSDTAQTYRDEKLKEDVKMLVEYLDDLTTHAEHFKTADIASLKPLSTKMVDKPTVGTMGNLPTLRLKQYYRYIKEYNEFLEDVQSPAASEDQKKQFKELKAYYHEMEDLMYLNVHYGINFILYRFLSFKDIPQPSRFNSKILGRIWASGIIDSKSTNHEALKAKYDQWIRSNNTQTKDEFVKAMRSAIKKKHIDIFEDDNSYKLMGYVGDEFEKSLKKIQTILQRNGAATHDNNPPPTTDITRNK